MAEVTSVSGVLLSWLSLLAAMDVRTQGQCPAAADVLQRLEPILPRGPTASPGAADVATVEERADGTLRLSLARADGTLVGRRELPRASSCAHQADAVAVTLAVWEATLHLDVTLAIDRLPSGATPAPAAPAPAPQPPASTAAAAVHARPEASAPRRDAGRFVVGVGAGVAAAPEVPDAFAPAVRLEGAWLMPGDVWRVRLAASGGGEVSMQVPPGEAYWRRLSLSAALDARLARFGTAGQWRLLLGAGPVVGHVGVRGSGYPINRRESLIDAGAEATLRLERDIGRWRGWLAVGAAWWLRSQELDIVGRQAGSPVAHLPRGEVSVVLGAAFPAP